MGLRHGSLTSWGDYRSHDKRCAEEEQEGEEGGLGWLRMSKGSQELGLEE